MAPTIEVSNNVLGRLDTLKIPYILKNNSESLDKDSLESKLNKIKLLTISANNYALSQRKKLGDYEILKIRYSGINKKDTESMIQEEAFLNKFEVVVDLLYAIRSGRYIVSGTALRLK